LLPKSGNESLLDPIDYTANPLKKSRTPMSDEDPVSNYLHAFVEQPSRKLQRTGWPQAIVSTRRLEGDF
jgi:hypothetical protein